MSHPSVWRRLCLVAAGCALLTAVHPTPPAEEPAPTPSLSGEEVSVTTRAPAPYATVGQWEGKLAVFAPEGDTPEAVYDVFIASLPPSEQEALCHGIPVHSETELQGLLQDYTG